MHAPTRELLDQNVYKLDVPTMPEADSNAVSESGAYAPISFNPPFQGMIKPVLDPDMTVASYAAYPKGF